MPNKIPRWDSPEYAALLGYKDPVRWISANAPQAQAPVLSALYDQLLAGRGTQEPISPLGVFRHREANAPTTPSPEAEAVAALIAAEERAKWAAEPRAPKITRGRSSEGTPFRMIGQERRTYPGAVFQGDVPVRGEIPALMTPTRLPPRPEEPPAYHPDFARIPELLARYQAKKAPGGGYVSAVSGQPVRPQKRQFTTERAQEIAARKSAVQQLAVARNMQRQLRMGRPVAVPIPGGVGGGGMAEMLIRTGNPQLAAVGAEMLGSQRQAELTEAGQRQTRELAESELSSRERLAGYQTELQKALGLSDAQFKRAQAEAEGTFRKSSLEEQGKQTRATERLELLSRGAQEDARRRAVYKDDIDVITADFNAEMNAVQALVGQGMPVEQADRRMQQAEQTRNQRYAEAAQRHGVAPPAATTRLAPSIAGGVSGELPQPWAVAKGLPEDDLSGAVAAVAAKYDLSQPRQARLAGQALAEANYLEPALREAIYKKSPERWSHLARVNAQIPAYTWGSPLAFPSRLKAHWQTLFSPEKMRVSFWENPAQIDARRKFVEQMTPILAALETGGRQ